MKSPFKSLPLAALALALSFGAFASSAKAQLLVTEVKSDQSANPAADYWELTNFGLATISLVGYTWDDDSESYATGSAWALPAGSSIAGGESVIFTGVDAATFRTRWGISETVKIFTTTGSPGLSGGDRIAFFNNVGTKLFTFNYDAGGFTKSNGDLSTGGHAGLSAGGVATDALIWDPTSGMTPETARYTAANGSNFGSFTATGDDGSPGVTGLPTSVDLSMYVRVGRYDLPEPTRTTPPDDTSLLAQEASGVTYNWDTDTLFICADGGTSIVQVSKTGELIDSMTLAEGNSPQDTDFYDPEGITYIGNNQFVMTEERDRQVVLFTYAANTTLSRSGTKTVKLGTFVPNTGTEGLSFDPQTGGYICLKEIDPIGIFQTEIDFDALTATNGSPTTENSTDLFDPALLGMLDVADVFALSNLPILNGRAQAGNLLVLSQESANIVNVDRAGNISSTLTIQSDLGNPLTAAAQQHEGLTMDRKGNLYVVSENGGGNIDHPQLWVYSPSTEPNQAPTAVALTNPVNSIVENSNTAIRVKVADITITDDGLGTNTLTVSGDDASFFEIVAGALFIKAGTVLDYETKTSYSVTVELDDVSIGATPDATVSYNLTVTDLVDETPVLPAIIISEVAPWSSGNSLVAGDWFELTNTSSTTVDITGWKVDDNSNAFAQAIELSGITSIAPGESVVFIEKDARDFAVIKALFESTWFGANPPAALQIGSYEGSGIGLSTGGDALNLYNSSGVLQANVTFGASPSGPSYATFNNAAGQTNTAISLLSVAGVNGAFVAAGDSAQIGSPGSVGSLFISEVAAWSSSSPVDADWFEVTNTMAQAVDITGWKVDDSTESPAAALALNGITSIAPGESVIFMETDDLATQGAVFLSTWFGDNPPAGLKLGSYTGSSIGLSGDGDAVNLYNSQNVLKASVYFADSPGGPSLPTFDNAVGLNNAEISQLSVVGVNGAFAAVNDANEIGSPGSATVESPALALTVDITPATFSESAVNPAATGTVTRTGSTLNSLVVSLVSSDDSEATVPATVTILAGEESASFDVTAINDSYPDGNIMVTVTATASGADAGSFDVTVNDDGDLDPGYKLLLTEVHSNPVSAGSEDYWELTNAGTSAVDLSNWKWTDGARTFASGVTIPSDTSIAAGESIILTAMTAESFRSWWGISNSVQVITVVSAPGLGKGDGLTLYDSGRNEILYFSYNVDGFMQSDGSNAEGGHAGASGGGADSQALVLDPTFGTDTPRYTAATAGTFGAFASTISTLDIGSPGTTGLGVTASLSLTLDITPTSFSESAVNPAAAATVTRSGDTTDALVVNLSSSDTSEATVPATVTILAGEDSASFDVTAIDDSFPDGNKPVIITATATDANSGTFNLTVNDDADVVTTSLRLTEVQSNQSATAPSGVNDYWELTNFGEETVDLAGYSWHDKDRSAAAASAYALPGGASIEAGESVIFTVISPSAFRAWWGIEETVKVFQTVGGPGLGKDDGVSLFDNGGNELFFFSFAAGQFTREDGSSSVGGHAGPSAGATTGADSVALIWVPTSGSTTPRYTFATGSNYGSFQAAVGTDLGSPGTVDVAPVTPTLTQGPLKMARLATLPLAGAEISAYDAASRRLFVTCSAGLQVVDISNPAAPAVLTTLTFTEAPISLSSSDITSVDVFNGTVAVAVPNADKTQRGHVVFLNAVDGSFISKVQVGYLPDHITFSPDGSKVLTADEGEYQLNGTDPNPGTVSIIDVSGGFAAPTVATAGFTAFDSQAAALKAEGVRIFEENGVLRLPSLDFEPEYLAVSADSTQAMVTLQEANAVAVLDITTATFTSVVALGEKDFSTLLADFSDRDGPENSNLINLTTGNPVFGLYMPDSIASFKVGEETYYVIANEGDDRNDFITSPTETITVGNGGYVLDPEVFPDAATLKTNARLGRLTVSNSPGLRGDTNNDGNVDRILMYGARSFSILDSNGEMIYDSGDDLETTMAAIGAPQFDDGRSDNKGPEPEGIEIGVIDGRTYAFVGLERHRTIVVYDVTDPGNVTRAGLVSFPEDLNPEGIQFISAKNSANGKAMIAVTNETSNTMTLFSVEPENFTLQLLHLADGEAGLLAPQTAPNLAALVDAFDDQYTHTLILSGGDNFIPSPFLNAGTDPSLSSVPSIGATAFARPDIAMHNIIGVEASAIGNHEWDLGSNVFMDAIGSSGTWIGAQFPHISANLDYSADSAANAKFTNVPLNGTTTAVPEASSVKSRLVPTAVITKGGEKIGLVGVTTQLLRSISSPSGTFAKGFPAGTTGVDDMDLLASQVQPYINELIAEGVNKIVLLSHLQQLTNERSLATKLTGVDIILAAGSNTRLGDEDDVAVAFPGHSADFADTYPVITAGVDSKPTLIINTDNEYTYLGRLTVEFDEAGEVIVSNLDDRIATNGAYASTAANVAAAWNTTEENLATTAFAPGTKGAGVKAITDAVQNVINIKDGQVYGYTSVYLEGERSFVRSQETNLGNITADANSQSLRAILGNTIPIVSVKNGGGIRAQIGAVSSEPGSSEKLPPQANPAVNKPEGGISQLDVENALRFNNRLMAFDTTAQGLKAILEHGVALWPNQGRFPHIAGVAFAWNPTLPAGNRITSMALIDENDVVVMPLYKDGYFSFVAPPVIRVVTLNFMAQGGDSYPMKANGSNFRYILTNGSLGPVITNEALDFTVVPQLPENPLGEQQAFTAYISARYPTPETAYDVADTPASADLRIQNLNFREDVLVPVEITADSDGDGLTDVEELAYGSNPNAGLRVGENVNMNLSSLAGAGNTLSIVGKLPPGLKFDPVTGKLTGQILGNASNYALQILVKNGKTIVGSYALDLSVTPFPAALLGNYEALLETGSPAQPKGVIRVFVSKAGTFSATLDYAGASRRSTKGTFSLTPGSNIAVINLTFAASRTIPALTAQLEVATNSPLVTGTYSAAAETGTQRGFRMAAANANPPAVQKIVSVFDTGAQNGVDYPAGQGWAKGSVSKAGAVSLKGLLGDAQSITMSLRLSATGQALVWSQPYKNKASYVGGIMLLGNLGQPLNLPQRLENGLQWMKVADVRELAYEAGFASPMTMEAKTSKFIPVKTSAELSASLGLAGSVMGVEIEGGGISNEAPNNSPVLPVEFTLDTRFKLTTTAPPLAVLWTGLMSKTDGGFSGSLTLPIGTANIAGKAAATGVILQDDTFGSIIGGGLIKVPVAGRRGAFRTSSILLEQ
ncbi:uncharacterized protein YjiK [Prosthecobacter fusiformis]|uniref:Uncharacterized protein YjiK n=1 Tax=Prosthecobacter fusiformis TaxID=48464 RepID=A0A4R7S0B1_9BACT|nr:choice-of-anchor I family protein [Prosthecobacter fusiformis]TDU71099.1 uncharacterized protein YjiK [Prosthecobacter fusiformis]